MQKYEVLRDFPQNGKSYRKGGSIDLTERQARHLRIGGFIRPAKEKQEEKKSTAAKKQDKGSK